jgi:DNA polymerase elongation subunit (family B)
MRARVLKSQAIVDNLSRFLRLPMDRIYRPRRYRACSAREQYLGNGKNARRKVRDMPLVETPGLIQFDAFKTVKQMCPNLDEYKLKSVADKYDLKVNKKEMPYECISPFWALGAAHQREVAIYCDRDVEVTKLTMIKASFVSHAIEVSRLTFSSIIQQMMQGQQIKTFNLMVHEAHNEGWILDEEKRQSIQRFYEIACDPVRKYLKRYVDKDLDTSRDDLISQDDTDEAKNSRSREKQYAGATVLDAVVGFYAGRVTTADFASLYPSLMIAYKLCFSTFLPCARHPTTYELYFPDLPDPSTYVLWNPKDPRPSDEFIGNRLLIMVCHDNPSGITCCFVANQKAFLPGILQKMLALRKKVKKEMAVAEASGDAALEKILDAQQAAIKVICNAAYGFTGALKGYFGCIPIAITTCFLGRLKILYTKETFENVFGARIIYGDTDSVFAVWDYIESFPGLTEEQRLLWIQVVSFMACEYVSNNLPHPMALAFEKLMSPYLLIGKKQYTGEWIWPHLKFFTKGISSVRRDSCTLSRDVVKKTMALVLNRATTLTTLMNPLRKALEKITDPKIDLEQLKRTVAKSATYKNPNIMQAQLFRKIEARRQAPIEEGTRVPYIITLADGGKRFRKKGESIQADGEDIQHMKKHPEIRPDRAYYLERQLLVPLSRYLVSIPGAVEKVQTLCHEALAIIERQDTRGQTLPSIISKRRINPF